MANLLRETCAGEMQKGEVGRRLDGAGAGKREKGLRSAGGE